MIRIDIYNKAIAYVKWNEVLLGHFFGNNVEDNVRISITKEILNELGEQNDLGTYESFLSTVLVPKDERILIYGAIRSILKLGTDNKKASQNIWKDAVVLYKDLSKGLYFNYIVLLMYIAREFVMDDTSQGALGTYITNYIETSIEEKSNYALIENLFDKLSQDHPEFKNLSLTRQRYIGLIRYQIGLTEGQISKIERALYNSGEQYDKMTFDEQRNILKVYLDDEKLKTQLDDNSLEELFSEIIDNFDAEEYEDSLEKDNKTFSRETRKGELFLAIDEDDKLLLLTKTSDRDITVTDDETTFSIFSSRDTYGEYNSNPVEIKENGEVSSVKLQEYRFKGFRPLLFMQEGIIFFQELKGAPYLIQTRILDPQRYTIVLVKKLSRGNINKYIEKWEGSDCYLKNGFKKDEQTSEWSEKIFGKEWLCYDADIKEDCVQYFSELPISSHSEETQAGFAGGIRLGRKGYLATALPYLKLPLPIEQKLLTQCGLILNGKELSYGSDYNLIWQNDCLIVNLLTIDSNRLSLPLTISITYNGITYQKQCLVKWLNVEYDSNQLKVCDSWGQSKDGCCTSYLCGNKLVSNNKAKITSTYGITIPTQSTLLSDYHNRFYFIALLSACCFASSNYMITHSKMEKCIRYACTRMGISVLDKEATQKLIKRLIAAGYINVIYTQRCVKYQIIPPALIEVPQSVSRYHMLALIGAYTYNYLNSLERFCKDQKLSYICEFPLGVSNADQFLPPIVLISKNIVDLATLFYQQYGYSLEIMTDMDYPLSMALFANGIEQYESTLESDSITIDDSYLKPIDPKQHNRQFSTKYPYVRILANTRPVNSVQYLQRDTNKFYAPTIHDYTYLWLYAAFMRNERLLRTMRRNAKTILALRSNSIPYLLERAIYLMAFQHLYKAKIFVLNSKNIEYPLFEDAYVSEIYDDNNYTRTKALYSKLYPKHYPSSQQNISVSMRLYRLKNELRRNKDLGDIAYLLDCSVNKDLHIQATKSRVWIKYYEKYYYWNGHTGSVNSIISTLVTDRRSQFKDLGIVQCGDKNLPDFDLSLYESEPEELIIVNESLE